ncbi:HLA class II histocompatibility antigen gamma chain isoform X3 [Lathamus discolor]|uniref:HLA class II histocompatibility antigen gamma chain isoform X3 n=1 Tax=Lathamus discolor TaxID=678569 RepID=UPI0032B84D5F
MHVPAANGDFFCPRGRRGRVGAGVFPVAALGVLTAHRGARSSHGRRAAGPHLQPRQQHAQRRGHPKCGGGTFTLRFHFCTSRRGQFVLVWWQSPREGMVMVMLRSALGSRAALSTLSILVALLIAGQAVTIYFVYQQSGQISKLTKTSQTLQLEALQRKLPTGAKTVNKMKMAMVNSPMVMRVLPMVPTAGNTAMAPASNRTEDQVKHLLLQADPRKMFPELKDNLMDNLKRLKSTMAYEDWQSFESWMHKWLLFEMAKNPKPEEEQKEIPAKKVAATAAPRTAPELEEMMFSGVDMLRLGAEKVN